ncbi:MAG: hypothetical protein WBC91_03710 [Phototrophicaceae bacterium]
MVMQDKTRSRITALPAFSHNDMRQVNTLIQKALLSSSLERRLLAMDNSLQIEFALPTRIWDHLSEIKASSLSDFCGEILRLQCEKPS